MLEFATPTWMMPAHYKLWFAGIGFVSVLVMWGMHRYARKSANARILARGVLIEGEVVESSSGGDSFGWTEVTYTYVPAPEGKPVRVTRKLDGRVQMLPGQRVFIRYLASHPTVSLLVGHEDRHDAS